LTIDKLYVCHVAVVVVNCWANPATTGGSAYFDGSGDYLVTSGTGGFNPRSTFTVEFWTYPITNDTVTFINSSTNTFFYIETNTGTLFVGDGSTNIIGTTPPALNRWTHVLLSFDGTTYRLFYNGVSQATSTSLLASNTISNFRIGLRSDGGRPFNGYITDMRVIVGTALYTAAFTPPTAPLTPTANTSLLLSATNSAILDQSMMNDLETVGNAQISTSVVKYGTASMYFDGTGDYLTAPSNPAYNLGSGNFTIEFWVYPNTISIPNPDNESWLIARTNYSANTGWSVFQANQQIRFRVGNTGGTIATGNVITATTW